MKLPKKKNSCASIGEEFAYVGPIKLVLVQPPNDYLYYKTIFLSVWMFTCHLLIGYTVLATFRPFLFVMVYKANSSKQGYNYWNSKDYQCLAFHAYLCTIAYQLIIAESIMCLNHYAGCRTPPIKQSLKIRIHWISQIVGSAMGVAGIMTIFIYKGKFNFNTIHGLTGMAAAGLTLINILNGVCPLYASKTTGRAIQKFHSFIGLAAFILSSISLMFELLEELTLIGPIMPKTEHTYQSFGYYHYYYVFKNGYTYTLLFTCAFYTFGIAIIPFVSIFSCQAD